MWKCPGSGSDKNSGYVKQLNGTWNRVYSRDSRLTTAIDLWSLSNADGFGSTLDCSLEVRIVMLVKIAEFIWRDEQYLDLELQFGTPCSYKLFSSIRPPPPPAYG